MPIPPFLQKTFDIFSNPEYADVCGWGKNNDSILVSNSEEFANVILPKYFKHSNYASFTRQLHKYDFHKTVHNPRHGEFKHPYFIKDRPDLLPLVKRKVYVSKKATSNGPHSPPSSPPSTVDGTTDGETDGSSDKDGSGSSDSDYEIDFDFLNDDDDVDFDFEQFDEIEASVERGIIAFDDERISVLEKRQAHLMEENEATKKEIINTMRTNEYMVDAIDTLLNHAITQSCPERDREQRCLELSDDMGELCEEMRAKCILETNKKNQDMLKKQKMESKDEHKDYTDLE